MIISYRYKFIFFAIPKTASHAIRFAIRPHLGPEDQEHVEKFKPSKLRISHFENRINGHISVDEIKPQLPKEVWDQHLKFTFVRNPWDRFVSACFFKYKIFNQKPDHTLNLLKQVARKVDNVIFRPQSDQISSGNTLAMNFIGRFENLQESYDELCNLLELPSSKLEYINSSKHQNYTTYYDKELIELVRIKYKRDIKLFEYEYGE